MQKIGISSPRSYPDLLVYARKNNFIVLHTSTTFRYEVPGVEVVKTIKSTRNQYIAKEFNKPLDPVDMLNYILLDCVSNATVYVCSSAKKLIKKLSTSK